MSEELRQLRKVARIARQITRNLTVDALTAHIERTPKGGVLPVTATGRQWRDLIVALSAADAAAGGVSAASDPDTALQDREP